MVAAVAERPAVLLDWRCWHCHSKVARVGVTASPIEVKCWKCGKLNRR